MPTQPQGIVNVAFCRDQPECAIASAAYQAAGLQVKIFSASIGMVSLDVVKGAPPQLHSHYATSAQFVVVGMR